MSWRTIVISKRSKLDLKLNHLVVRQQDQTKKVFIGEIALLIIESIAVSLTVALLSELTRRKVKVIFCDETRNPSSELISYYGSHDTSNRIRRQINWDREFCELLWTEIVRDKISKQANFLRRLGKEEFLLLEEYLENIQQYDSTNREGHAAKVYFNALYGKAFSRTQDTPVNAALNYGYGIILSAFNREIVSSGYMTQIGLFHDNMFNEFNLGSDLMEPFRVLVDEKVYDMQPKSFEAEQKYELVDLLNDSVVIDNRKNTVLNAIKLFTKSIFTALDREELSIMRVYRNEL